MPTPDNKLDRVMNRIAPSLFVIVLITVTTLILFSDMALIEKLSGLPMILVCFLVGFRFYKVFQLVKSEGGTDANNVMEYLNGYANRSIVSLFPHIVIPFPVFTPFKSKEQQKLKTAINISSYIIWILLGVSIVTSVTHK